MDSTLLQGDKSLKCPHVQFHSVKVYNFWGVCTDPFENALIQFQRDKFLELYPWIPLVLACFTYLHASHTMRVHISASPMSTMMTNLAVLPFQNLNLDPPAIGKVYHIVGTLTTTLIV